MLNDWWKVRVVSPVRVRRILIQGEKYVGRSFMLSFIFPVSEYVRRILEVERRLGGLLNKSSFQYLFVWVSSSG